MLKLAENKIRAKNSLLLNLVLIVLIPIVHSSNFSKNILITSHNKYNIYDFFQ